AGRSRGARERRRGASRGVAKGFRVQGSGFRVQGSVFSFGFWVLVQVLGSRSGSRFWSAYVASGFSRTTPTVRLKAATTALSKAITRFLQHIVDQALDVAFDGVPHRSVAFVVGYVVPVVGLP